MRKVLAICLMVAMVLGMSVSVFAAPDGFVSSPSGNPAPDVIISDPNNDDCTANLVVTPYSERNDLPEDIRKTFEKAYDEIVNAADLTDLNATLGKLAADKNINKTDLAVSDLFNIHATDCENHEEHIGFDITLGAETLEHFVGLLQLTSSGVWEMVEDAQVTNNGEHLVFSVDEFSTFAIVVDASKFSPNAPEMGDDFKVYMYALTMAVSAIAIVVIAVKSKKQAKY